MDLDTYTTPTPARIRNDCATWGIDAFTDAQMDYVMEYVVTPPIDEDKWVPADDYKELDDEYTASTEEASRVWRTVRSVLRDLKRAEANGGGLGDAMLRAVIDVLEDIG